MVLSGYPQPLSYCHASFPIKQDESRSNWMWYTTLTHGYLYIIHTDCRDIWHPSMPVEWYVLGSLWYWLENFVQNFLISTYNNKKFNTQIFHHWEIEAAHYYEISLVGSSNKTFKCSETKTNGTFLRMETCPPICTYTRQSKESIERDLYHLQWNW